ncbi:unnamed protein product [Closterium sp. NIES-64]|nr:unnamed protein product [Closterium sp. NIES-64]
MHCRLHKPGGGQQASSRRAAGEGSIRAGSRSAGSGASAPASSKVEAFTSQGEGSRRAAGEQQARGASGRAAGARAAGHQRRPHQKLREEAPGGGLLRREAAGGAAAALTSPSRYQLSPPLRCRSPSQVQVPLASVACGLASTSGSPFLFHIWQFRSLACVVPMPCILTTAVCVRCRWRGGALGSTPSLPHAPPLWPSLAMQQRQLMGPVVAASAVGSTGGGEGCGVNTDAPSRPSPLAVQGGGTWRGGLLRREAAPGGDWREAAVHHGNPAASRESIGVGLALQGTHGDGRAAALQQLAVGAMRESIGAEGGSTGARAGEWSPPSHSPPPLSRLPSLPAAPCLDHRGVSPSPNPLLFPLPSSLSIMALCTAVVGTGKGMGVKCGLGGWGAWEQVGSSLP